MLIRATGTKQTASHSPLKAAPSQADSSKPAPSDTVRIDWSGKKPAHRGVKRMTRMIAGATAAAGIGKAVFDVASAPDLTSGLVKAGLSLGLTAGAVTAIDLGSGLAHHFGDNYLNKPNSLKHTQWHTEPDNEQYCMVGFSNKALDAVEFWPKWEKAIHAVTGKEPISWQVPQYRSFCLGEMSAAELHQYQVESGMIK